MPALYGSLKGGIIGRKGKQVLKAVEKPDFTTGAELVALAEKLPRVVERPTLVDIPGMGPTNLENDYKALVNESGAADEKKVHAIVGSDYKLVTHQEILMSTGMALQEMNLPVVGKLFLESGNKGAEGSRLQVLTLFDTEDAVIQYRNDSNGDQFLHHGLRTMNSYDGSLSLGMDHFGLHGICSNFCEWGEMFNRYKHKHTSGLLVDEIEATIAESFNARNEIVQVIEKSQDVRFPRADVPGIFRAIGLGERRIKRLTDMLMVEGAVMGHENEAGAEEFTAWTLYNTATQFLTHEFEGNVPSRQVEARRLNKLLKSPGSIKPKAAPSKEEEEEALVRRVA